MEKVIEILKGIMPNIDFEKENNLIDDKILTSQNIVRLVSVLNEEFDIEISPLHMVPENFNSAENIYNLVQKIEEE